MSERKEREDKAYREFMERQYKEELETIDLAEELKDILIKQFMKKIKTESMFEIPWQKRVDISEQVQWIYDKINWKKVKNIITEELEKEIARKLVNKIITEMGNDIKNMMSVESVRSDLRYFLRSGIERITNAVKENEKKERPNA